MSLVDQTDKEKFSFLQTYYPSIEKRNGVLCYYGTKPLSEMYSEYVDANLHGFYDGEIGKIHQKLLGGRKRLYTIHQISESEMELIWMEICNKKEYDLI